MPLRSIGKAIFHSIGGLKAVRYWNRHGARILMYHRFSDLRRLEQQCRYLRQTYHLVSLTEIQKALQSGEVQLYLLAVTVDDGYADFQPAFGIFREFHIPVTVFLATGFLDGKCRLWVDEVNNWFEYAQVSSAVIPFSSGELRVSLESIGQRRAAAERVRAALKRIPNQERLGLLQALRVLLRPCIPSQRQEANQPLTWDQVRDLAAGGVAFGAHTVTHPILSRLAGEESLVAEIEGSKRRIEEELNLPVLHFCYPNGLPEDFEGRPVEIVQRAGFQTAVTTEPGLNFSGADLFRLKRIAVMPEYEESYFRQCAAGFRVQVKNG